jgi:outer membrane protein assembly factor BamB
MTNKTIRFRTLVLIAGALAMSGCSIFKRGSRPKTPVVGERIAILTNESDVVVDEATAALPMSLPLAVANGDWAQAGGSAGKSGGHVELGQALGPAFAVRAGSGNTVTRRIAASPIVANGRVYTMDSLGAVRSFDATNGALIWASQTPNDRGNEHSLYGGGIAYANGRIFATNGLGFVSALDEQSGGIVWQVRPAGPLRGSPTVFDDTVYVMTQDNQIFSLKQSDGSTNWSQAAALEIAGVFGTASPAVAAGTVVAGFSSGELNAYRYENGRQVWQDALQRTSIRTSVSSLSDIDASPIIDGGQVFAIGQGGRMVALELTTGQRQWEINVSGISTPWLAGDWLYVVTSDAKLICVNRLSGKVRWINELPAFSQPKRKRGQIDYRGPILAGNRLIVVGSNGVVVNIDPATGSFQSQTRVKAGVSQAPVVANSTLYLYDDDGNLYAYR